MLHRLLPKHADNHFEGHRASLWMLGLYIALKLVMSFNSIFNTAKIAAGPDGIPLESFSPAAVQEVLTLFALTGLGQLSLALVALTILVRYRAMVPFITVVLLAEAIARRLVVQSYAPSRADTGSIGFAINLALLALLGLALLLSLMKRQRSMASGREAD